MGRNHRQIPKGELRRLDSFRPQGTEDWVQQIEHRDQCDQRRNAYHDAGYHDGNIDKAIEYGLHGPAHPLKSEGGCRPHETGKKGRRQRDNQAVGQGFKNKRIG